MRAKALATVAFVAVVAPGAAFAHANLLERVPTYGARLATSPRAVSLRFDQGVDVFSNSIDVRTSTGKVVTAGPAHTIDGGRTWERVEFDYEGRLRPIAATGDTVVALAWSADNSDARPRFVVGGVGGAAAGGRAPRDLAATPVGQIAAGAIDADHWQIGSGSKLWTTDTGGRTWRQVTDFTGFSAISAVHFLTPEVGFVSATGRGAAADAAVVLRTNDGGATWTLADGWQLFGRYH